MSKTQFTTAFALIVILSTPAAGQIGQLANEGKRGLHVRSIDEVLRLSEEDVDLGTAVLVVSEQWSDMVQGRKYLAALDEMAIEIGERLRRQKMRPTHKAIPIINDYLFGELGFTPISDADDPNDLFLHSVLDRRRGYCLSLSVLYLAIGERLGMPLQGVVVPGHFFVRYESGQIRFNIETTSKGAILSDDHYIDKFKVPSDRGGIYMKSLSKVQTLGCFFNNLGNVYHDTGNLQMALLAIERAVQINPDLSESRANLGNIYLKLGRVEQAISQYQTALEINLKDPRTHSNIGNAYLERGWLNYAVGHYRQSLELDPNFVDGYRNLAIAYCRQERYTEALSQLRQAINLVPTDAGLYRQMADVYCQTGSYSEAMAQFNKAIAFNPDLAEAYHGLGICYSKLGMAEQEIGAYKRALAIKPDMVVALVSLGNAYFTKKDYDSAIGQYSKAAKLKPDDSRINYNLGSAYSNKGNFEQAVVYYSKAVSIDPDMGDAHYGLAYGLYMLKKYDTAWKHINIAVKLGVEVPKEQIEAIRNNLK